MSDGALSESLSDESGPDDSLSEGGSSPSSCGSSSSSDGDPSLSEPDAT